MNENSKREIRVGIFAGLSNTSSKLAPMTCLFEISPVDICTWYVATNINLSLITSQGSDCVHPFVALQSCIKENPTAFSRDVTEDGEVEKEEEKPSKGYKLYPPLWSVESKPPKKN